MELLEKAQKYFMENNTVDIVYATSDGMITPDKQTAQIHSFELPDKKIETFYNDKAVRDIAEKHKGLKRMITVTDWLKLARYKGYKIPEYSLYQEYIKNYSTDEPVKQDIYNFVSEKVYRTRRPVTVGQKDTIFTFKDGIVEAYFLRRYPQGQVFQYMDRIILTCPTNTELVSGSYFDLFGQILKT